MPFDMKNSHLSGEMPRSINAPTMVYETIMGMQAVMNACKLLKYESWWVYQSQFG